MSADIPVFISDKKGHWFILICQRIAFRTEENNSENNEKN